MKKFQIPAKSLAIALLIISFLYLVYVFNTYGSYDNYINGRKRLVASGASTTTTTGATTTSTTTTTTSAPAHLTRGGIFIPLYKYPNKTDPVAIELYGKVGNLKVPAIVILNPSSGRNAFSPPSPNWVWAIDQLKNQTMICYIPSGYGTRPLEGPEGIYSWVDAYIDNGWKPDGFHIDEVSSNRDLEHYTNIKNYIKSRNPNLIVSFNPGVLPMESIGMLPDVITIFEKRKSTDTISPAPYMTPDNTKRWRAIAREISKEDALTEMEKMKDNLIYWKYVTDSLLYSVLPSYFDDLIKWIEDDPLVNYENN